MGVPVAKSDPYRSLPTLFAMGDGIGEESTAVFLG